jgi:hypothetical protein
MELTYPQNEETTNRKIANRQFAIVVILITSPVTPLTSGRNRLFLPSKSNPCANLHNSGARMTDSARQARAGVTLMAAVAMARGAPRQTPM